MKRVLSVQDLSCLGKCSLTVALPVLSAMGCSCSVLPTAVLSTHTAFPNPTCRSLTEDLLPIGEHWHHIGAAFDLICVGYLADPEQAEQVSQVLELFGAPVVLDPVMGDRGRLYSRLNDRHIQAMKQLCKKASIVLPNVTEAALLTGLTYRETADEDYLRKLAEGLLSLGPEAAVITGFLWEDGQTGFFAMDRQGNTHAYKARRIPKHFHGTGDLFTAVFTGGLLSGRDVHGAGLLAADFVEQVISVTEESTPFGIEFEALLPRLWQQL